MARQSAYGGRNEYRAFVRAWLEESDPVSTLVSVRGMSGIGKSTWLSEMAAVAEESGAAVVRTSAKRPNRPLIDTRQTHPGNRRMVICIDDADQLADDDSWLPCTMDGTVVLCLCTSRRLQSVRSLPFLRGNWHTYEWVLGPFTVTEVKDWLEEQGAPDTSHAQKLSAVSSGHPGYLQRIFHSAVASEGTALTSNVTVAPLDQLNPGFSLPPSANPEGLAALAFLRSANFDELAAVCGPAFNISDYWDMARHEWVQIQGAGLTLLPPADALLRDLVRRHTPTQAGELVHRAIALLLRDLSSLSQHDCRIRLAHVLRLAIEHRGGAEGLRAPGAQEKRLLTPWAGIHLETLMNPSDSENLLEMIGSPGIRHSDSLLTADECSAFYIPSQLEPQASTQRVLDVVRAENGEVVAWRLWLHLSGVAELSDILNERLAALPGRLHTTISSLIEEINRRPTSEEEEEPQVWILLCSAEQLCPLVCTEADLNLLLSAHSLARLVQPNSWFITGGTPVLEAWAESKVTSLGMPVPVCVAMSPQSAEGGGCLRAWNWPMRQTHVEADSGMVVATSRVAPAEPKRDKSGLQPERQLSDLLEDDVRQILRRLNHIPWLNDFADARALLMDGAALRDRLLGLLIADVPPEPLHKDDQRVLRVTYLERPGTAVAISARLAVSRSTYYRQLAEAHERLTAALSFAGGTGNDTDA